MENTLHTQCTCPENISSMNQLCESCSREYERGLLEEAAAASFEVRWCVGAETLAA